ncbi:hybrid sensor histidine kinase/response regulator [Blastopirellula marina]|uniref:histidine kinase n=1 Tax=Blastopirellula marina TaxID=124 RepID=A0A2S8G267_9BACT|nr:response regulator [Blastopirellula marina]PQO38513.1 hypothetical protein C5Y98_10705 [Blastopirellula marina]PTL45170.1 hybrid sensor histidine kinase/response regulator [Blastopirellula marina]
MVTQNVLKILLLEDDDIEFEAFVRQLKHDRYRFVTVRTATLQQAMCSLDIGRYDVVVTDLRVPDSYGVSTIRELQQYCSDMPLIVNTGLRNRALEQNIILEGAHDLFIKGETTGATMSRAVIYAVQRQRVINELQRLAARKEAADSRRELQTHENELQPLETKSTLLGDISNDLRTPLTIVKDFVTIVKEGMAGPINKEQQRLLERALVRAEELNFRMDGVIEFITGELRTCGRN